MVFGAVLPASPRKRRRARLARTINPVHTPFDGDTIFALSTGTAKGKFSHGHIGAIAAEVMAQAVLRAVTSAQSIPGLPAYRDLAIHS